ncbi:MAG: multiheme c-type cytochrome [Planctomycetota bacterium]
MFNAIRLSLILAILIGICTSANGKPPYAPDEFNANKVLGYEQCQKCHGEQVTVLKQHPHFSHARPMQRDPAAIAMAKKLGGKSVKRSDRCIRCHYTPQESNRGLRAISAVSCESCHGPSQDWILVHNVYGDASVTRDKETPSHKMERHSRSIELGMRHPSHVYTLARSCFRCHIIDDEELVNIAGHKDRSLNFDFVAWSQGNMRHNFLRTQAAYNAVSDPTRLQTMYVVGLLTDIEYSLRSVSKATKRGTYATNNAIRCRQLQSKLVEVQGRVNDPRLASVITSLEQLRFGLANVATFAEAAKTISKITWDISLQPGDYKAIADMVPAPNEFKGQPFGF